MESFEDNIEKEYHERFQDFEEMPDDAVWNKIQELIAPEPQKRPIVFWWNNYRSMAIAASLLLSLTMGGYLFSRFFAINQQPLSDKKANSKAVEETEKTTHIRAKNKTQTNFESPLNDTADQTNKVKIASETDDIKTTIAKKTTNKIFLKSNIIESPTTEIAIVEGTFEKTENIETLTKQEVLPKSNVNLDPKVTNYSEKQSTGLHLNNTEEPQNSINFTTKNESKEADKQSTATQELAFLISKGTDIQSAKKTLTVPVLSQSEPIIAFEEPQKERLVFIPPTEIYANVSPMLNYYVFSPNRADNFVVKDFNSSSDRLSFAAQLGVVYPLSKKLDIRTGLSFMTGKSNFSYGLTNNNQKVVKVIDELNIEVQPTSSISSEQRNWQYLEIQSDLMYAIKKLHAVSVGFRAGFQTSALNKPVFNGRVGYRISKPVNERVALWLEPSVVLSLSSQQSLDNHFLFRTTGFSLNMGVSLLRSN